MKTWRSTLFTAVMAVLAGCQPAEQQAVAATPAAAGETAWRCPAEPGTAPSGTLSARRIAVTEAKDDLPRLYEGPVWHEGSLYYSDFLLSEGFRSRIQRFTPPDRLETAIISSGSNGLALDAQGRIVAATHDRKELARFDVGERNRARIVGQYQGNPFNSPNDLVIAQDGTIYFTDPDFQRSAAVGGQDKTRVYRYAGGEVSVVDDSIANPNGIALSPAGDVLYVAGGGSDGVLRAYPLVDGKPQPGTDLAKVAVPDGMAVDCLGNLYVTEHSLRRVRVLSPAGAELARIDVDANITNAAFGGPEMKTLYLTGAGTVWSLDLDVAGLPY
ncbi:SMP-30/gluconolactonase/LRE family protein [Pseudoxanthomonas wuyuanensis]|uniref:Gluconolactonase n=1 Tax=Pseudoxanthomonas wuyuanensis TaxID=1073196 RepID=A0A286D9Z1_9GAMM|nr:SMP-30/gluconolactonase/LRE family protein [Pseudoxanthomonas wuyuanensis]KAF1720475.1 gluconolactonase [Pseudoxanthomonas wuyuanensis]SOD55443.1 gluconolactonase [Pseudoxanthomonas wuyuanensis]